MGRGALTIGDGIIGPCSQVPSRAGRYSTLVASWCALAAIVDLVAVMARAVVQTDSVEIN